MSVSLEAEVVVLLEMPPLPGRYVVASTHFPIFSPGRLAGFALKIA
jgi:hypothetical protein